MRIPKDLDLNQLCLAAQRARLVLRFPREERLSAVKQTAGFHYSEQGSNRPMPLNMLGMYRTIVGGKLVANNPRGLFTTDVRSAKPVVEAESVWVNKEIVNINLVETLQRSVDDSLYCMGIVKVGIADPGMAALMGWTMQAGQPYAENIDLDDFVFDVHCKRLDQAAFIGHRYRIPLKVAKKLYGSNRNLEASEDRVYNMDGDERTTAIMRTTIAGQEEFEDMCDLWEFYLPRHKLIVTLRDDDLCGAALDDYRSGTQGKALDIRPYIGPRGGAWKVGPYEILAMDWLAGNPLPMGPIMNLVDLNEDINELYRKLLRQAKRQKEVIVAAGSATKDAAQLLITNDGEAMYSDRPDQLKAVMWGGPNQQNFQLLENLIQRFNSQAGNLELLGGLGPQSKTAKQDEMLNANSSAIISNMQQKAIAHAASIFKSLCWYYHYDPARVMKLTYALPGMPDVTRDMQVHPFPDPAQRKQGTKYREHDFEDMNIRIDPYSLQYQSPQERMAAIDQVVTQVIIPLMPLLQQKGVDFDIQAYLAKKAKLGDMPDLIELIKMVQPPQPQGDMQGQPSGAPDAAPMPQETTRNYVRRSEGGATNHGTAIEQGNRMTAPPMPNGIHKAG